MLARLNKLAYSPCSRAIITYTYRTIRIQKRAYLSCKPTLGKSRCHPHNNYSKMCDVQCTKGSNFVYRTAMSSQPPEDHRQFSVMLAPKHTLLHSSGRHILSREMNPPPWLGVGLGLGSSRGLSTEPIFNAVYFVLEKIIASWPVELSRQFFTGLHDTVGIPWWLVIISGTVCFRLVLLPLHILSLQSQGRLLTIQPEIKTKSAHIIGGLSTAAVFYRQTPYTKKRETRLHIKQMKEELYEKHNCAPLKPLFVMYVSTPIFLACGFGVRSFTGRLGPIADMYFRPEMAGEGLWWFHNLTIADPYCILPAVGTICAVFGLEYSKLLRKVSHDQLNWGVSVVPESNPQKVLNILTCFGQGVCLVLFPILCFVPSGFTLYFCTVSLWSVIQLLTLHSPTVKQALSIPMTQLSSPTPHKDVIKAFQTKYLRRKKATPKSESKPR
ncbi:mitochondrial inner membrane protein COX18-like [Mizuhopecten yessoensis]|uniref:Mitochondrial inner membrane protein COX18 n=1 Tax=Mizuhopecten yessoensis TaxID=6573 RepID=A0A210PSZ6_MIZYE|nr:mitochondrial inner membrane protein COX18-like [Mizuhopecten yessoensis]OWF39605.1 Mitochondrial inner membrane protein COX18 [Mizuhopecten yessoensis]